MKKLLFLLTMSLLHSSLSLPAREVRFFLGAYTDPGQTGGVKSPGLFVGTLDTETGRLGPVCPSGEAENPTFVALSPDGKFLYAALERKQGAVAAFRVNPNGSLAFLNELPAGGAGTCHVSVAGGHVFAANYGGASLACFATAPDGSLKERTALIPLTGGVPHPRRRQQQSYGHAMCPDRVGRFVYGCDLGADQVLCFKLDAASGNLEPNGKAELSPGAGPRHLAFSARGDFAYVCNELDSTVTVLACDAEKGQLTVIQTLSLLRDGEGTAGYATAEILLHPNGKWLYVSNRDCANKGRDTIAVLAVGPDGRLTKAAVVPAGIPFPRSFDLDPSGKWIVVASQTAHRIAVLKVDPATGIPEPAGPCAEVPAPVCVLFAR